MNLVQPAPEHLASYIEALERGWSDDSQRPGAGMETLTRIQADAAAFLEEQTDPEGLGPSVTLPDGTRVPRLPSYTRWMWDGEFAGSISFRWRPGTTDLPPYCLGHIGYNVVPWKRGLGYATRALGLILPLARDLAFPFVELTTDTTNIASQRVILKNGGEFFERFTKPASSGGHEGFRYRIPLLKHG